MAWTENNPVSIGAATRKYDYDALWDNADYLADRINGDNAQGSGATGHDHSGSGEGSALGNDVVTGAMIADDQIDSEHYVADSIDTEHYAPGSVDQDAIADDAVGTGELKTTTPSGVGSNATGGAMLTLTGGAYCFYPQVYNTGGNYLGAAQIADNTLPSSYATKIFLTADEGPTYYTYARSLYVSSSGELNWYFVLRDKISKQRIASSLASDHVCFGNGGNPNLIQHPFEGFYDPTIHEILVAHPTPAQMSAIAKEAINSGRGELQVADEDYEFNEVGAEHAWPSVPVTVDVHPTDIDPATGKRQIIKMPITKPTGIKCYQIRLRP